MAKRPPIPTELEREVLLEAGHRCAIHTCRQAPIVVAHIVPWAKCKEHAFDNLIALCPNCHSRFDKGDIDRKSMYAYKHRLLLYTGRFTQFELRVLVNMKSKKTDEVWILDDLELLLAGLLDSGYLTFTGHSKPIGAPDGSARRLFKLTPDGHKFIDNYVSQNDKA